MNVFSNSQIWSLTSEWTSIGDHGTLWTNEMELSNAQGSQGKCATIKWTFLAWEITVPLQKPGLWGCQGSQSVRLLLLVSCPGLAGKSTMSRSIHASCSNLWSQQWCYLSLRVLSFGVTLTHVEDARETGSAWAVPALLEPRHLIQTCLGLGAAPRSLIQAVYLYVNFPFRSYWY